MDLESFARLVRDMRQKQKAYFAGRSQTVLQESKDLERRVDTAVKVVLEPPVPGLFDAPAPCDHAWEPDAEGWYCPKCLRHLRHSSDPPRGNVHVTEKPPPNSGGEK